MGGFKPKDEAEEEAGAESKCVVAVGLVSPNEGNFNGEGAKEDDWEGVEGE